MNEEYIIGGCIKNQSIKHKKALIFNMHVDHLAGKLCQAIFLLNNLKKTVNKNVGPMAYYFNLIRASFHGNIWHPCIGTYGTGRQNF